MDSMSLSCLETRSLMISPLFLAFGFLGLPPLFGARAFDSSRIFFTLVSGFVILVIAPSRLIFEY